MLELKEMPLQDLTTLMLDLHVHKSEDLNEKKLYFKNETCIDNIQVLIIIQKTCLFRQSGHARWLWILTGTGDLFLL